MQKKLALTAVAALISLSALPVSAKTLCPFTDNFQISAPLPLGVLDYEATGNINVSLVNNSYFQLSCRDIRSRDDGIVYIQIGLSDQVKCSLTINDGPYTMNPTVTYVYCGGPGGRIYYTGMDHAFGSYTYTLKFTM